MSDVDRPARRHVLASVFISPTEGRLRAGWRLVLQVILQLLLTTCAGVLIIVAWRQILTTESSSLSGSQILLAQIGELFAITLSVALARRVLDRRTFSSLGLQTGMLAVRDFGAGLAITFLLMGLIFVLEISIGWLRVSAMAWQSQAMLDVATNTGLFLVICLVVGWNEEVMSRGYHLQTLASGLNLFWGWVLSSLVFGVLHLANPHASLMAVAGIVLAGLFLGYAFIRTGQLWLSIGLHTGWNFFEGVVFGFPVSGLSFYRITFAEVRGPEIFTGGAFGPEAGLVVLPALLFGFLLVWRYSRGRRPA